MSTLSLVLAIVLGIVFLAAGVSKVAGRASVVANFKRWGYADVIRTAVGTVEILAGALLLIGAAVPALAVSGVLLVIFVMVGALFTHQRAGDPVARWVPPVVLLVLALVLAYSLLP